MRFRLFGVPVTIRGWFWIGAILMGLSDPWTLPLWVAMVLVSVLFHELGHALAIMRHGVRPSITLHGMGGTTSSTSLGDVGRVNRIIISAAGPFAGFLLAALAFGAQRWLPVGSLPRLVALALQELVLINVVWSVMNLLPVLPLDGGHVLESALGPRRARLAATVSLVVGAGLAILFLVRSEPWGAFLFGMFAYRSYQVLQLPPGARLVDPLTSEAPDTGPGPLRRWWLKRKLKSLQAENEALRKDAAARRRAAGPSLKVIRGGADDEPPKDKRYLN